MIRITAFFRGLGKDGGLARQGEGIMSTMRRTGFGAAAIAMAALFAGCNGAGSTTSPSIEPGTVSESGSVSSGPVALFGARALTNDGPTCTGARSPGFYCQNQSGKNPNLTEEEFAELLERIELQELLIDSDGMELEIDVGLAVCNVRQQLERQIAALVLNLAANLIDESTPLVGGMTVGDALDEALLVANDPDATKEERNEIKDVLDAINNDINTILGDECVPEDDEENGGEGEGEGEEEEEEEEEEVGGENGPVGSPPPAPPPAPSQVTICHKGKKTLTIAAPAWPAHEAHGDKMGPCVP